MKNFLSFLGALIAASGVALAHYRISSPALGVALVGVGAVLAALLFFPALFILFRTHSLRKVWLSFPLGLIAITGIGFLVYLGMQHPINDISTDTDTPPVFRRPAYVLELPKGQELLDKTFQLERGYNPEFSFVQMELYPGLSPIKTQARKDAVFGAIKKVIQEQFPDWKIVYEDPQWSQLEATTESEIFHFVDDIVIRIKELPKSPGTLQVDLRSRSRVGKGDLGKNADRLQSLVERLQPAIASLPKMESPSGK